MELGTHVHWAGLLFFIEALWEINVCAILGEIQYGRHWTTILVIFLGAHQIISHAFSRYTKITRAVA